MTLLCVLAIGVCAKAESTVYLFAKNGNSIDYKVFCDGKEICDLNGPIKKTMDDSMFKIPYKIAHPCYRKLVFGGDDKIVIAVEGDFTNCMNLKHTILKCEMQLDLEDGETYYIDLKGKGMNDIQLKFLEPKKALKNIEDKKWKELSEIVIGK